MWRLLLKVQAGSMAREVHRAVRKWHTNKRTASSISARVPRGVAFISGKYAKTKYHTICMSSASSTVSCTCSKSLESMGNSPLRHRPSIVRPLILWIVNDDDDDDDDVDVYERKKKA